MVQVTEDGDTFMSPKITSPLAVLRPYRIVEPRWNNGAVIEMDTGDAEHAEMIADPDISEQIGGPVPRQISRSQALLALKLTPSPANPAPASLFDDIDGYINSLNLTPPADPADPNYATDMATFQANLMAHTAWNQEPYFERLSPAINGLGTTLGLTQDQLDDLFRSAVVINV
jgi:hypothetical protein